VNEVVLLTVKVLYLPMGKTPPDDWFGWLGQDDGCASIGREIGESAIYVPGYSGGMAA
jgi:hypothetical protein